MIGVDDRIGAICYELKYPLNKSVGTDSMVIDLTGKKYLDICVETPEINTSKFEGKGEKLKDPQEGKTQDGLERDIRPPKNSEEPKPPKPELTKKPPMGRISQWIRVGL
jgi:hypothetical protein